MRERYFKRNSEAHEAMGLNMSSLPDLIFTVLFFFMIVTHMRDVDLKVHYEVPQGTEVQKLGHKASVVHIYVGRGDDGEFHIQLNNEVATLDDIKRFLDEERARMTGEDLARMTVSIKADRDAPMGVISDIKRELQQALALRINYSATKKADNSIVTKQ